MSKTIINAEFLKELGYTIIKQKESVFKPFCIYGTAKDKIGYTIIHWNTEGSSCTYFGEKLNTNINMRILKDGGTRTVFSGYIFCQEDLIKILSLTA